jgi:hypothetical protein
VLALDGVGEGALDADLDEQHECEEAKWATESERSVKIPVFPELEPEKALERVFLPFKIGLGIGDSHEEVVETAK